MRFALLVLALIAGVWWNRERVADEQRALAGTREIASLSEQFLNRETPDAEIGVLLALRALRRSMVLGSPSATAYSALRTGIGLLPRQPIARLEHASPPHQIAFSRDGARFATADESNAYVHDIVSGKEVARIALEGLARELTLDGTGARLAVVDESAARLFDVANGHELDRRLDAEAFHDDDGKSHLLRFDPPQKVQVRSASPDGRLLATADAHDISLWDVRRERRLHTITAGSAVWHFAWTPDARSLATSSFYQTMVGADASMTQIWEVATGRERTRIDHDDYVSHAVFSANSRWIAVGTQDGTIRVYDARTGRRQAQMVLGDPGPTPIPSFDPTGRRLAVADGRVARIWDVVTGREVASIVHLEDVERAVFGPNGRLATMSGKAVKLWEPVTGRQVAQALSGGGLSHRADYVVSNLDPAVGRAYRVFRAKHLIFHTPVRSSHPWRVFVLRIQPRHRN